MPVSHLADAAHICCFTRYTGRSSSRLSHVRVVSRTAKDVRLSRGAAREC